MLLLYWYRFDVLRVAFENFKKNCDRKPFTTFKRKNSKWLKNYALYMAVKKNFDMKAWNRMAGRRNQAL